MNKEFEPFDLKGMKLKPVSDKLISLQMFKNALAARYDLQDVIYEIMPCHIFDIAEEAVVDPVKHGHWKLWAYGVKCSVCGTNYRIDLPSGTEMPGIPWWHYCSNCGAKMDEAQK